MKFLEKELIEAYLGTAEKKKATKRSNCFWFLAS